MDSATAREALVDPDSEGDSEPAVAGVDQQIVSAVSQILQMRREVVADPPPIARTVIYGRVAQVVLGTQFERAKTEAAVSQMLADEAMAHPETAPATTTQVALARAKRRNLFKMWLPVVALVDRVLMAMIERHKAKPTLVVVRRGDSEIEVPAILPLA